MVEVLSCPPRELPDYLADEVVAFGKWYKREQILGSQHIWSIPLKTVYYVVDPESGLVVSIGRTANEAASGANVYFSWKKAKSEASEKLAENLKTILNRFLAECRTKYKILSDDEKANIIESVISEFLGRVRFKV
jgi:hypothetical protein